MNPDQSFLKKCVFLVWFGYSFWIVGETFLHGHDLVVDDHPGRDPGHHQQEIAQDRHPGKYAEINKKQYVKACRTIKLLLSWQPLGKYILKGSTLYLYTMNAVFRIHDILVWIRIRGSMPLTNGSGFGSPDPDPAIFVIDLQDANKKLVFFKTSFSADYYLKVHLHQFSKI
jgi:hypothetical protein